MRYRFSIALAIGKRYRNKRKRMRMLLMVEVLSHGQVSHYFEGARSTFSIKNAMDSISCVVRGV